MTRVPMESELQSCRRINMTENRLWDPMNVIFNNVGKMKKIYKIRNSPQQAFPDTDEYRLRQIWY